MEKSSKLVRVICFIAVCTLIGASYGWVQNGWPGAIAFGFVGLCLGIIVAAWPQILGMLL